MSQQIISQSIKHNISQNVTENIFLQKYRFVISVVIILAMIGVVLYFIFKKKDISPIPSPTSPISPIFPFTRSPSRTIQPNTTQPNTTQPNTTQPNTTQPNTTQPNTTHPNTTQPNTTQPNTTQPNTTQPNTSHPNTSHPNKIKPNTTQPNTIQPFPSNTPVITPSCNGNGDYMPNLGFCWCRDGWYGNYCENPPPILTPQPTLVPPFDPYPTIGPNWTPDPTPSCNGRGYYVSSLGKCICNDNWTGTYCEMAPVCKGNAYMENGICKCYIGWYGENCDSRTPPSPTIPSSTGIPDSELPTYGGVDINNNVYNKLRYSSNKTLYISPFQVTRTNSDGSGSFYGIVIKGSNQNNFYVSYSTDKEGINLNYSYTYNPNSNSIIEDQTNILFN